MSQSRRLLLPILIIIPALACRAATRLISRSGDAASAGLTPTASSQVEGAACTSETGSILRQANSENLPLRGFPSVDTGTSLYVPLVTYTVKGDEIIEPAYGEIPDSLLKYQKDFATQRAAWELFASLIPQAERQMIGEFQIMTDGPGGVLSAIEQTANDPRQWILETDIADIPDAKNLTFTLLHEFGHLLTLGPAQVPPNRQVFKHPYSSRVREHALAGCSDYFPGQGCSLPTSYINVFHAQFWTDISDEWRAIDQIDDDTRRDAKLQAFYRKHRDQFVDSYAASSPMEDIAETWAFYVLSARPSGISVEDQKIQFFYRYPELVALRAQILNNLCALNP